MERTLSLIQNLLCCSTQNNSASLTLKDTNTNKFTHHLQTMLRVKNGRHIWKGCLGMQVLALKVQWNSKIQFVNVFLDRYQFHIYVRKHFIISINSMHSCMKIFPEEPTHKAYAVFTIQISLTGMKHKKNALLIFHSNKTHHNPDICACKWHVGSFASDFSGRAAICTVHMYC